MTNLISFKHIQTQILKNQRLVKVLGLNSMMPDVRLTEMILLIASHFRQLTLFKFDDVLFCIRLGRVRQGKMTRLVQNKIYGPVSDFVRDMMSGHTIRTRQIN